MASRERPARVRAPAQSGAAPVTLPVIGEFDVAAIPGLRAAIASLNGGPRRVLLDLSGATLVDRSTIREPVVRDLDRHRIARGRRVLRLRLLGRDRAEAWVDGRSLRLSRRHSEIAAVLSVRRDGMTSEELATELYGDAGLPSTARVEVCRLRKLLGASIDNGRYRLCTDVDCDVEAIRRLLENGAVREAAEAYDGPLLPYSQAPGVVRQRDALDTWVRHAVMTADDRAALWAWLRSPSGRDDLPAWKRLLADMKFNDPRRSLAAARLRSLRDTYATAPDPHHHTADTAPHASPPATNELHRRPDR